MEKKQYKVAVIGSGPGGYVAAIRCAQLGMKTVCIEKEKTLGGTCLNVGCIPSKALLTSTEYYEWIQKSAKEHGLEINETKVNFQQMQERKNSIVQSHVKGIEGLFKKNEIDKIEGVANLVSPHSIEIQKGSGKEVIEAENIILATGSEPIPLPFLPFDEKKVLSSTGALAFPTIPKKMLVVGAGVIGVELASVYSRLGTQITIIEMLNNICPAMDGAVSKMLLQILKKQGLEFHLGAKVTQAKTSNSGVALTVEVDQKISDFTGDVVLVAIGRRPYTKGLGLQELGIKTNSKGFIEIDSNFRTSIPHIYAIGDAIEGMLLAHRASEEGVAAAEIIAGQSPHVNYLTIPNVIYTHPEVAALGMTEEEAKGAGLKTKIGICFFKANSRARALGETEGFVKVIGESGTDRLIGLHILGTHASEMIGEGVLAMEKKGTVTDLAYASHAHPTLTEAIKEAALNALGRAIHF